MSNRLALMIKHTQTIVVTIISTNFITIVCDSNPFVCVQIVFRSSFAYVDMGAYKRSTWDHVPHSALLFERNSLKNEIFCSSDHFGRCVLGFGREASFRQLQSVPRGSTI